MLPSTVERVPQHTPDSYNMEIQRQTEENIARFGAASQSRINHRLKELDREWDIERTLEANAATITLLGVGLGALVDRRLLALPALVAGFLLQHALQGWCPPVPLFRHLGFRTQPEIEQERYALKAMRGDFEHVASAAHDGRDRAAAALQAVRR